MRKIAVIILAALMAACTTPAGQGADTLLRQIDSLYAAKAYQQTLDSIESFRLTDSALQATGRQLEMARSHYDRNMLSVKRDSLQARYDVLCAQVRYILMKQKEYATKQHKNEKVTSRH